MCFVILPFFRLFLFFDGLSSWFCLWFVFLVLFMVCFSGFVYGLFFWFCLWFVFLVFMEVGWREKEILSGS